jgi:N6-adenosine-specific RNA methylase IME4
MSGSARLLIRYDNACRALAEARSVDEVKDVRDKAIAMAAYARQARNRDLEADAIEIRLRATRRLDQLRQAQKATVGLNEGGRPRKTGVSDTLVVPTLASQGIDKNLAKQGRVLGALSNDQFESAVASARDVVTRAVTTMVRGLDIVQVRKESYDPSGGTVADLHVVAGQRFNVIYADPPWPFEVYSAKGKQRSAERHYDTMSLEEIKALPIAELAADDCALFLWVVNPQLPGALDAIRSWGFQYKTIAFTWVKQNRGGDGLFMGLGYWTRANAESCLLATRGSPSRLAKDVHQIVMAPVAEHSRKPDEVRTRIERLVPGPYLELFARRPITGWTTWGDEIATADLAYEHADDQADDDRLADKHNVRP